VHAEGRSVLRGVVAVRAGHREAQHRDLQELARERVSGEGRVGTRALGQHGADLPAGGLAHDDEALGGVCGELRGVRGGLSQRSSGHGTDEFNERTHFSAA
jgi:hypothetical protein